jgi:hypothetical protein
MLKPLLLSGWFRVQPFLKYVLVVILITPFVVASGHSTSAKQSEKKLQQIAANTPGTSESSSGSQEVAVVDPDLAQYFNTAKIPSPTGLTGSAPVEMASVGELRVLQPNQVERFRGEENSKAAEGSTVDPLGGVQLAPSNPESAYGSGDVHTKQMLVERLRASRNQSLLAATIAPTLRNPQVIQKEVPAQPDESQIVQNDPVGSPHPIPWKWILATQDSVGSKGGGVRFYRSMPVVSPDGKSAVYSRVQLEVKPEMHNSRVSSVLFVQDMQSKRLRVVASTSSVRDPLMLTKVSSTERNENSGKIGVLVPVSWSEKGDRFLARQFVAIFNTADMTDHAVIWDRQRNRANTVTPANDSGPDHEKIAVLLGWSKSQPDHVLFRAGELGQENWPMVKVGTDGKTIGTTNDTDQPVTFGQKFTEVWGDPQVAYR